jgi:RNA polymerase sigma factor (sigma-70 family)
MDTTENVEAPRLPSVGAEEFVAFYGAQWPGAVRLAALLTQSSAACEDLAQEAFVRIYRNWSRSEHPQAYLRTTIVNLCRNWHAHNRTERGKLPLLYEADATDLRADELTDALGCLPYRQHAVLVLRYYLRLSEADIAVALGCRPGTVKSLAARALAQLEKVIER